VADTLTQNGLSIGGYNGASASSAMAPSILPVGSSPASQINQAAAALQSIALLQYPSDLPKYYMGFQIFQYNRTDLMTVATTNMLQQLCMPMPDQMLDVNQVAYDKKDFSSFIGNIANAAWPIGKQVGQNIQNGNAPLTGVNTGALATTGLEGGAISGLEGLTGGVGGGLLGAAGYSPNYFLTVVLNGPQYKQHSFSWTCAPRSPQESATLRQIIRVFEDAQAPGLALNGTLFSFPRVFQNYFGPDRGFLYQFKPSILMSFAVNYTPGGMPSMKQSNDPVLNGWHAPTAVRIQATFMELEFWLRGDFGDTSQGAQAAQGGSNLIQPVANTAARGAS
jgi:hypothetical protein